MTENNEKQFYLSLKSTKKVNELAEQMAKETGRSRSKFIRDLIQITATQAEIRWLIINRMRNDLFNDND